MVYLVCESMAEVDRQRCVRAGTLFTLAGLSGAGSPIDLQGSAYLIGFAHGQKFREMKEQS